MFKVLSSGLLSTIQDFGRQGYTHLGITPSGAMDIYAYRWSQKLVGDEDGNALEILLCGLKLQATEATIIAVTGADLGFHINGIVQPIWQTHQIEANDILCFKTKGSGMRAYLSVKDGFTLPRYEKSFSTTLKENRGKQLEVGDSIPFTSFRSSIISRVQKRYIPSYSTHLKLRIVLGYQHHYFSHAQKEKFFSSIYTLTSQMSRMGYKLQGEPIIPNKGGIISEGIALGAVQIPPNGQPIILLKERQTIGGYPKMGSILSMDCFKLAQMEIGSSIVFEPIDIKKAQGLMREFDIF